MKRNLISRIFATLFFAIGMLALIYYIYEKFISTSIYSKNLGKDDIEQKYDTNTVQYKFSYNGKGNLKQIIHLNKGEALFTTNHKGDNNYTVELKTANDSLIKVIFNVNGDFKGKQVINVPENDAYILDIKTEGEWEIAFK
ncbi:MAG: hypothetical protein N2490_04085 [Ignavibacteria bacterium]|nr:hypothetical protein [Ignavibacteria bacterium]